MKGPFPGDPANQIGIILSLEELRYVTKCLECHKDKGPPGYSRVPIRLQGLYGRLQAVAEAYS